MSFFDKIGEYARRAGRTLGIIDDKKSKSAKPVKKASSEPILEMQEKTKVDTFKSTAENKEDNSAVHKKETITTKKARTIEEIKFDIEKKCKANGLNAEKVIKGIARHSGLGLDQYNALSNKDKIKLWKGVETIIDEQIKIMKKYGTSPQASQEALLLEMIESYEVGQEKNSIQDGKEFVEDAGDVNRELGKDFHKKSKIEQNKRMEASYKRWLNYRENKIKEALAECKTEAEKADVIKKTNEYLDEVERIRYGQFLAAADSETGYRGLRLMGPRNMGKGHKMFMNSRINNAEKARVANDIITFNSEIELIEAYKERGEAADAEAVKEFNQVSVMYKSYDKAVEFQNDYISARESGKYTELEENGIFTSMAIGIGAGAALNKNMTSDEKNAFIQTWKEDACKFNDYKEVVKGTTEIIENYSKSHPEEKRQLEKFVQNIKKTSEKISVDNKFEECIDEKYLSKEYTQEHKIKNNYSTNVVNIDTANSKKILVNKQINKKINNRINSSKKIEIAMVNGTLNLQDVKEKYGSNKTFEIISKNPSLVSIYKTDLINHIKQEKKADELLKLANSSRVIELIMLYNTVDNKQDLRTKLEKKATSAQKYLFNNRERQFVF